MVQLREIAMRREHRFSNYACGMSHQGGFIRAKKTEFMGFWWLLVAESMTRGHAGRHPRDYAGVRRGKNGRRR